LIEFLEAHPDEIKDSDGLVEELEGFRRALIKAADHETRSPSHRHVEMQDMALPRPAPAQKMIASAA
jgi:hypothetical protein